LARSGVAIGLKAPSQPIGTLSRDCCRRDAGALVIGEPAGAVNGKRSPLDARSTAGEFTVNKPAPGNDGNEIKLTAISAAAAAARTTKMGRIEIHSDDSQPSPMSPTRAQSDRAPDKNVQPVTRFQQARARQQ
jgi:hypothetical protein